MKDFDAYIDAHSPGGGGSVPKVIWVAPPPGHIRGLGAWPSTFPQANRTRNMIISYAKRLGKPFIDMYKRFELECNMYDECPLDGNGACTTAGNIDYCYRDGIHWTYRGQVLVAAQVIIRALTKDNDNTDVAKRNRTSDGICVTNGSALVCTDGKIGSTCTANADCDTWSANLGL
jgi:hypothetical protein